jgi:Pectate lyase superfamily protein
MKKFLFLFLFLPVLLFGQTKPVTINGNNADSIVSIKNIYTGVGTPILRWRSPIAKYNGSWMWFDAKNFKYDSISTRNDGTVTGNVMWTDNTGVLKFSPKSALRFIPLAGTDSLTGDIFRSGNGESYFGVRNGGNVSWLDTYVDGSIRIAEVLTNTSGVGGSYSGTFARSGTNVAEWSAATQGDTGDKTFSFKLNQPFWFQGSRITFDSTYYNSIRYDSLAGLTKGAADLLYAPIGGGGGGVASVTGTANRIAITGTATNPIVNIDPAYVGQSSIQTLGNITSGAWTSSTKIGIAYGGTNADLSATGGTGQVLKQSTVGGIITVGQVAANELSGLGANVATALGNTLGASGGVIGNSSSNTLVGSLGFSGTTNSGLRLNNLTTTQVSALTPSIGMVEANTTTNVPVYYDGTKWVSLKYNTVYNVKDWGAKGDGTTDDKAAIDACISAAPAGSVIYFPRSTYFLSAALATISKTLNIKGDGRTTFITVNSTTGSVLKFDGGSTAGEISYINIEDLYIANTSATAPTNGSAIQLRYCAYSNINRVNISNFNWNILLLESYMIGMTNVNSLGAINAGLYISNTDAARVDWGDSYTTNCTFLSSAISNTEYGIVQNNSGGLKVTACKFLRAGPTYAYNYHYYYVGIGTTVKLMITGNSFDTFNKTAIYISKGAGAFSDIAITGNTIESGNVSFPTIYLDGLYAVSVTGNTLTGQATNAAIEINNCNDVNLNNSYRNYNAPISLTGTNTNISGNINANYRAPYVAAFGGQAAFLNSVIGASQYQSIGVGFTGLFSGTASTLSGRNAVVTDAVSGTARWGVDQNGTIWVGANSTTYGMYCTQAGVAAIVGALAVGTGAAPTTGKLQVAAGSASIAGLQLTNQTAYTGAVVGSISLENTNDISHVGNIVAKRGATTNIGTSDSQILQLVTGNTNRVSIGTTGIVTLTAALVGTASQDVFNTISTTVNAFGAATSLTLGGTSTAAITYGIGTNATATATTKTINIGTGGVGGSTSNINLGSATSGATSLITVNGALKLPVYTVATLPTAVAGTLVYVSDALTPIYNATVTGGGAEGITVVYNGSTWTCH